jgi:hypothetical protein
MAKKKWIALLCIVAFLVGGTGPAAAYTLTGTGYVLTNETVEVIVPSTLDFTLDLLGINERGAVFSEAYPLVNKGATDVILTFTDIQVIFGNDTDFAMSDAPIDPNEIGGHKKAYLALDFGNPAIAPIVLTDPDRAAPPEIVLKADFKEDAEYALSVTGSINPYPEKDWQTGDVSISLTYQLNTAAPLEAAESEELAETGEATQTEEGAPTEEPTETEAPTQPETSAQPEGPAQGETPTQTEKPAQSEGPAQTETPARPEKPAQTGGPVPAEKPTGASKEPVPAGPPGAAQGNPIENEEDT